MKLLTKSTLLIATLSLFLFFIMGVIFFQVLKNMSKAEPGPGAVRFERAGGGSYSELYRQITS